MKPVSQEDLELDRRVTRTEEGIGHNRDKIDFVDRNTKSSQTWFIVLFASMITLFIGLVVGQFYFIHNISEANQQQSAEIRQQFGEVNQQFGEVKEQFGEVKEQFGEVKEQFGEVKEQFGEVKEQFGEVRAEVAENRRLIEENSVRLDSLTTQVGTLTSEVGILKSEVGTLTSEVKETNERLAVVENVLTTNPPTSAYYQAGKF